MERKAIRLRSLDGTPDQAFAEAGGGARRALSVVGEDLWTALGGTRIRLGDPRHLDHPDEHVDGDFGQSPTFEAGGRIYTFDMEELAYELDELAEWSWDEFAVWKWSGFLLEQALGQERPWDATATAIARWLAVPWRARGPYYLSALDEDDVIDRWAGDMALLRAAGL